MNLYEINEAIARAIEAAVDEETGEIVDEQMFFWLNNLQEQKEEKVRNVALYIKNLLSDAEQLKAEKKRLADRQAACENKAERLKKYLFDTLDGEKYKDATVSVYYSNSEAVELDEGFNVLDVDEQYLKYKDPDIDKAAIKKALKDGETVKGAHLAKRTSLVIR